LPTYTLLMKQTAKYRLLLEVYRKGEVNIGHMICPDRKYEDL